VTTRDRSIDGRPATDDQLRQLTSFQPFFSGTGTVATTNSPRTNRLRHRRLSLLHPLLALVLPEFDGQREAFGNGPSTATSEQDLVTILSADVR
jgi:hypothetical protein